LNAQIVMDMVLEIVKAANAQFQELQKMFQGLASAETLPSD